MSKERQIDKIKNNRFLGKKDSCMSIPDLWGKKLRHYEALCKGRSFKYIVLGQ